MGKGGAIRWTDAQLAEFTERRKPGRPFTPPAPAAAPTPATPSHMEQFYALGRMAKGSMNKTESAYAQLLEAKKAAGLILDWKFHVLRIRLADNTFYEPDFMVMTADREIQIHETKGGHVTKEGRTKIKIAAETMPWFRFFMCKKQKGGEFTVTEFNP